MITLRPEQQDAINGLRSALRTNDSALLQASCGFGKSIVGSWMAGAAAARGKRAIIGVHRRELARQWAKTLDKFGIQYGYIMSGMSPNPFARVQIASADTLRNYPELAKCDLLLPDEAHLWASKTRLDIINIAREHGHIVPLTATPRRGNGDGLGDIADVIVSGPSTRRLIDMGSLAQFRAYAPSIPDMAGLHTRNGEYINGELDERFMQPAVYGNAISAYRKFADGKRMIGYSYSRAHGKEMVEAWNDAGIKAAFIDGETPDAERRRLIAMFADRKIQVLQNVALFREGFDLSAQVGRDVPIEAVGLYAPTQSLPLAIQMMMRPMRPQPEPAILLDHAAIFSSHGLPDDDREWTLDGRVKGSKAGEATIPTCTCATCFATFRPAAACPYCGTVREVNGREVSQVEAELSEVDIESLRAFQEKRGKAIDINKSRSLEDLADMAIKYDYKVGWLFNKHKTRGNPKFQYNEAVRAYNAAKERAK